MGDQLREVTGTPRCWEAKANWYYQAEIILAFCPVCFWKADAVYSVLSKWTPSCRIKRGLSQGQFVNNPSIGCRLRHGQPGTISHLKRVANQQLERPAFVTESNNQWPEYATDYSSLQMKTLFCFWTYDEIHCALTRVSDIYLLERVQHGQIYCIILEGTKSSIMTIIHDQCESVEKHEW